MIRSEREDAVPVSVSAVTVMRKPRVLFVNTRSALGADVAVHLTLIQNLNPEAVEVHIATNRNSVDFEKTLKILRSVPHLKIIVCDLGHEASGRGKIGKFFSALKNLPACLSLLKLTLYVRKHRIDALHTTDRPRDAVFTSLLAKMTGAAAIAHIHIKWYPEIGRATTLGLKKCVKAIAISRFTRDSLIVGGVPAEKIVTIYNATDPAIFDPAKIERGTLRRLMQIDAETPLIGIVARIMIFKGHLELIEALAKVREVIPNVRLAIVGKADHLGDFSGESYADKVEKRIAELGLNDAVYRAGWQDDTPAIMADFDVQAVPSWEEPFGLVVTEGMALQNPIVGFASGALPEIITSGVEGLLVPPKDSQALAAALIELLQNAPRREQIGRAGRARVLKDFTPQRQAAEATDLYRALRRK